MTEIDFDELDKAVSELLNNDSKTSNTATNTKQDDTNNVSALPTEPVKNTPVEPGEQAPDTPEEDASSSSSDTPKTPESTPTITPAPAVQKRRGMFMDVKPPVINAPSKSAAVSRQGATVEPTNEAAVKDLTDNPKLEDVTAETPAESPDETAEETEITGGYAPNPAPAQEWPDPIDVAEQSTMSTEDPTTANQSSELTTPAISSEPPAAIAPEPLQSPVADQAMESPFIADAKVEKRPLGGPTPEAEAVVSPVTTPPQAPLPRELGSDIVSLESDSSSTIESESSARIEEPKQDTNPEKSTNEPAVAVPTPAESATEPAKNGAIYDTNAYHPPLLEARVKKKNGWLVVIWILVLLIAGACAGAAYFYLTTQQ